MRWRGHGARHMRQRRRERRRGGWREKRQERKTNFGPETEVIVCLNGCDCAGGTRFCSVSLCGGSKPTLILDIRATGEVQRRAQTLPRDVRVRETRLLLLLFLSGADGKLLEMEHFTGNKRIQSS